MAHKTILAQLHSLVNNEGMTVEQAVEQILPGADPKFWEHKLANYDPNAPKPKRRKRRRSSTRRRPRKRTFRADAVLSRTTLSSAEESREQEAEAMAELVKRVNRSETVEVIDRSGERRILEVSRQYRLKGELENRPILWRRPGGQVISLEVA